MDVLYRYPIDQKLVNYGVLVLLFSFSPQPKSKEVQGNTASFWQASNPFKCAVEDDSGQDSQVKMWRSRVCPWKTNLSCAAARWAASLA